MDLKTFNDLFLLDNEGLEDFDLQQANFTQLATQIQAYVDILEKAQKQVEQFAKLSTFADFTGFEVSDIDELYQSYIDQYTEMVGDGQRKLWMLWSLTEKFISETTIQWFQKSLGI